MQQTACKLSPFKLAGKTCSGRDGLVKGGNSISELVFLAQLVVPASGGAMHQRVTL